MTDADFNVRSSALFGNPTTLLANARLMEGIVGGAYNWGTRHAKGLAETGVDAAGISIFGVIAFAAGAGLFAFRRRRASV